MSTQAFRSRTRSTISCPKCDTATLAYWATTGDDVDADFVYHELAHHVVLFQCLPKKRADYRAIETSIEMFSMGIAQLHEMRVLALQFVTYKLLGWRPAIERLVSLSWPGMREVDDVPRRGGKMLVTTERQARVGVRGFVSYVSKRNVAVYTRALHIARGEI